MSSAKPTDAVREACYNLALRACEINTALDGREEFRREREALLEATKQAQRSLAALSTPQPSEDISDTLIAENKRLREALEPFASVADLIEAETEGFDDGDEIELIYHDYLFDRFTVHQFKAARAALAAMGE